MQARFDVDAKRTKLAKLRGTAGIKVRLLSVAGGSHAAMSALHVFGKVCNGCVVGDAIMPMIGTCILLQSLTGLVLYRRKRLQKLSVNSMMHNTKLKTPSKLMKHESGP